MTNALHIARSGLEALDQRMRTIANNLANASTTGFKRDRVAFETLLYQTARPAGAIAAGDNRYGMGLATGSGVRIAGNERVHTQGSLVVTGNALDLAIEGEGFFEVTLPDGRAAFTRSGNFTRDAEGRVMTPQGHRLAPEIQVPEGVQSLTIGSDGTVTAMLAGETAPTELGQLTLALFVNPAGLEPAGGNLFLETAASGAPVTAAPGDAGTGPVRQGSIEGSNVSAVQELVDMIETQRAYEINSKVISAADEMRRYVNQAI
jgi:flagellar basal-body rod protein FlgG